MKKGRIVHLEDEPEWIGHVNNLLGQEYDLYAVSTQGEAARTFVELSKEKLKVDLAIIDISLVRGEGKDKQGLNFIDLLEQHGILPGKAIIILTGYPEVDDNLRKAFRDYRVRDVFDKGEFVDKRADFKELVDETIQEIKSHKDY